MPRRDKPKNKPMVGDGSASAEAIPITSGAPSGGGGSAYRQPLGQGALLPPLRTEIVPGMFGFSHQARRSKPIPADAVQCVCETWAFDVKGYFSSGTTTAGYIEGYLDAQTLMADWYNYARQMGKAALKYKQTPLSLNNTANLQDMLNIAFYAIANLSVFFNLDRLYQYNQAFSTMYSFAPDRMSRAKRLWRRLSTVFLPTGLKSYAIKCGMIPVVDGVLPPYVRLWSDGVLTAYGGAADYTALGTLTPNQVLLSNTYLGNLLDNIEAAIWALEGNISDANTQEDFIAIKDAIDMLNDVVPGLFTQGLPDPNSFPGVLQDKSLFNDLLCRCNFGLDDGTDNYHFAFPATRYSPLNEQIPVIGFGAPGMEEETLLGAIKVGVLNSSTTGALYTADTDEWMVFGTSMPSDPFTRPSGVYTREDGWVNISPYGVDFNDGTACRNFLNSGHPLVQHRYRVTTWAARLTTGLELRFLDNLEVDYQRYIPEEEFGPNYAQMWGSWLGVPYIK